jgi:hypothetical protein
VIVEVVCLSGAASRDEGSAAEPVYPVRLSGAASRDESSAAKPVYPVRLNGAAFQRRGQRRPTGSLGYRAVTRLDLADAMPRPSALRARTVNT